MPPKRSTPEDSEEAAPSEPLAEAEDVDPPASKKKKKKAASASRAEDKKSRSISRVETPRRGRPTSQHRRVLSVNVAGLRAVLDPVRGTSKLAALAEIVRTERPDILCLNEHKLNPQDVDAAKSQLSEALDGWFAPDDMHFSCSTAKKGYSGVAMLFRPEVQGEVSEGISGYDDDDIVTNEGRLLTLDTDELAIVAVYVPNAGQDLKRLDYRVQTWDRLLSTYLISLAKPTVVVGDLNVAHMAADIHNMYDRPNFADLVESTDFDSQYTGLQQIKKQAGLTPDERRSFSRLLSDANLIDTFRHFYPQATGRFSYFSQRAIQNRPNNRGLRLDYVLVTAPMIQSSSSSPVLPAIHDSFILDGAPQIADHCAVGCDILF